MGGKKLNMYMYFIKNNSVLKSYPLNYIAEYIHNMKNYYYYLYILIEYTLLTSNWLCLIDFYSVSLIILHMNTTKPITIELLIRNMPVNNNGKSRK